MKKIQLNILMVLTLFIVLLFLVGCNKSVDYSPKENYNIIIIGWDGVQRDHFFECYHKQLSECSEGLPNIKKLSEGNIFNLTITDGATNTKAGWVQILSGYNSEISGTYGNNKYQPLPQGYSLFEKIENTFGDQNVYSVFLGAKPNHVGAHCKGEQNVVYNYQGKLKDPGPEKYGEPWCITQNQVDYFETGIGYNETNFLNHNKKVGEKALDFLDIYIEQHSNETLIAFFHFGEPDGVGHKTIKGENSKDYSEAIIDDDEWLGKIVKKTKQLGIYNQTLIYVVTDHGFDEMGISNGRNHFNAPFGIFATNDPLVIRSGDRKDITPTILKRLGVSQDKIGTVPAVNGFSLDSIPSFTCINESEAYISYSSAPSCCSGLKLINLDKYMETEGCVKATGGKGDQSGYCTRCGDGICKLPEDGCNCPADCPLKTSNKVKEKIDFSDDVLTVN